jgi:excisionase family DNA binding protein
MLRTTLTLAEFAEMVGISRRFVYSLIERGEAPPLIRIGNRVFIRREAAERWLAARETPHAPAL